MSKEQWFTILYELPPTKGVIGLLAVKASSKEHAGEVASKKIKRTHEIRDIVTGYDKAASTQPWI